MLRNKLLPLSLLATITLFGTATLNSTPAQAANNAGIRPGSLTYHKTDQFATIGTNYKSFKLYNHVPNSKYKQIKTVSWKKAKMSNYGIVNNAVHIDMFASQGLQYNWYRISKANVLRNRTPNNQQKKVQKYWVYGQALVFPKTTQLVFAK